MPAALIELVDELQLSFVQWQALVAALHPLCSRSWESFDDEDEPADEDLEDDEWDSESRSNPRRLSQDPAIPTRSPLLLLLLLLDSLERAVQLRPEDLIAHHALAARYRCARPNSCLHEASLKGRKLSLIEQGRVEDYLCAAPLYEKYVRHLKAAVSLGDRMAALECAELLGGRALYEVLDQMQGSVSALHMAELAPDDTQHMKWLRAAASEGTPDAPAVRARGGNPTALAQMAACGDVDAMRTLAIDALASNHAMDARQWQQLALL